MDEVEQIVAGLRASYPFLSEFWARRLVRGYGTEARDILGDAATADDLGRDFGATLTEREVRWLMDKEYAREADDVVWRRSKLGLRMTDGEVAALGEWMNDARPDNNAAEAAE